MYITQGFIWGQIFGEEPTHLFICTYVYTHMRGAARRGVAQACCCVFNDIKNHTHACSNDEDEAVAKYSDVRNGGQICMWNDSGLN